MLIFAINIDQLIFLDWFYIYIYEAKNDCNELNLLIKDKYDDKIKKDLNAKNAILNIKNDVKHCEIYNIYIQYVYTI